MKGPLKIDSEIALILVVSGLAAVPLLGWLPLLAMCAAVVMSVFIINNIRPK